MNFATALPVPPTLQTGPQRAAAVAVLALMLLGVGWELWWAPLRPGGSWLALKTLPLLAALPGIWRRSVYTCRWLSLLVWLYVLEGLLRVSSDHGASQWLAAVELLACTALFAACVWGIRSAARPVSPEGA